MVDSGDWREHIDLLTHRYMREDVAYGLAFLVSVASWAEVDAPVAKSLLSIASAVCHENLAMGPRTFGALGLNRLDHAAIRDLLMEGAAP